MAAASAVKCRGDVLALLAARAIGAVKMGAHMYKEMKKWHGSDGALGVKEAGWLARKAMKAGAAEEMA